MVDRFNHIVPSLFFGCLACLVVTTVVDADGRVFVLDMRNSSGLQGFRDAEQACASRHARLASAEELRHSVVECFFSSCTRGWLYGGTVGTTVCNVVGSTLKAVGVRTENGTEDAAHMDAFCIKDKDVPCGDPPSFPNSRIQGHSGYEMGDELLYTCVPGYLMPSGHRAFSLLCDSCGEWYGLVEICVKDETESHVDYEEKFTDSYGETEHNHERPEEAHGEVYEQVHGAAYPGGKTSPESQETSFHVKVQDGHQDQHGQHGGGGEVISRKFEGAAEVEQKAEERAVEDFVGHPRWEQERRELVTTDEAAAAATEAPVSQLSQKHLFWFPSEAFQEQGHTVSSNPVTQTTQRASGAQSEESKEHKSQEEHRHPQRPVDVDVDHGRDDHDDHDDLDSPDDSHHDDEDEGLSHQEEDGHDDHVGHYVPAPDLDRRDHDDHHDHYDMGEHEEDRTRVRYGSQEYDDHDDTYDEHESYEGHDDVTHDHGDDDGGHDVVSEEHPDQDDHEEDHGEEHSEADDSHHDGHDKYDDHDSHEDDDGDHQHVIVSIATDEGQNVTQKETAGKATTDDTWLDGYPVAPEGTESSDSTTESVRTEESEVETVVRTTDTPNEVDIRRPIPYTSLPDVPESPTEETALEQEGVEEMLPGFIPTAAASPDRSEPSDPPSYSDPLDYDTQQAAPTQSWLSDHTEHPFLDQDPAPPVHDGDILTEVLDEHNLPGETGERGEIEGEAGEATCTGENCPPRPPSSYSRGPTVAAIIVLMCAVATAVIVGVWCYRKQQQKTSVYEMNGKGQSQNRQGQQIEMQQKV